jgi:hypothetical protein
LIQELDDFAREHRPHASLPDPFVHETLDRSTHYFWEDGKSLVAWFDRAKFLQSATETFGPDAANL